TCLCGWGKPTTVLRVGVAATLPTDATQALARAREAGIDLRDFDAAEAIGGDRPDLVIDALLGIGASRPPEGEVAAAIGRIAALAAHAAGAGRVFVDLVGERTGMDEASTEIDPIRPELMFRRAWAESDASVIAATTVVCGCGGGDAVRATLPRLLSIAARLVLDADALNAIAADPSLLELVVARDRRGHATVMTPHPL